MSKVAYKQKNKSLLEQAAEQWVNLLISQLQCQKNNLKTSKLLELSKFNKNNYARAIK